MPRELNVAFYTTGGTFIADLFNDNSFFSMDTLLVAYSQNIDVSGMLSGLDGTDVVLRFTAVIPEASTGPGKAMIDNVSFYHSSVGLENENMDLVGLNISPNPAINELRVTATGEIGHLAIFDLTGKIVAEYLLKENESIIDVSDLASGSYLLKTDTNGVVGTQKFIKK
jgi:hypothetical protein